MIDNETTGRGYPLPAPPNRLDVDVVRLIAALSEIDADVAAIFAAVASKAAATHGHTIEDVAGLTLALNGKSNTGHTHGLGELTGVSIAGVASGQALVYTGAAWANQTLGISSITGLSAALSSLQAQIDTIDGGGF